jgi:secreted trypsin-like serine protease
MTAAHCADGANRFTLLLGAHDRTVAEPSQLTIETTAHATHPNWNPSTLANDVALIRLPEPITFTRKSILNDFKFSRAFHPIQFL